MKLAAYQLQMSPCAAAVRKKASSVGLSISQVVRVVSLLGLSAVSSAQAIGTSQIRANAISTPAQTRLKSLTRRRTCCATSSPGTSRGGHGGGGHGQTSFSWRRTRANHTVETARTTRKNSIETAAA